MRDIIEGSLLLAEIEFGKGRDLGALAKDSTGSNSIAVGGLLAKFSFRLNAEEFPGSMLESAGGSSPEGTGF